MSKKEIVVSNKHVKLRIVLTISFFLISIAAFTIGILSMSNDEPGFYEITGSDNSQVPGYNIGFTGVFYFDKDFGNIKDGVNDCKKILSLSLKDSFVATSDTTTYDLYPTIKNVNDHPNADINVGDRLYGILEDALNKTNEDKNFSLYAGPIYAFWDEIYSLPEESKTSMDPKNNAENKAYLENLVKYCNEDYIKLELKENYNVRLNVDEEYLAFREANEITSPLISLNILKDAYRLKMLVEDFEKSPYKNGYLFTNSGLYVCLSDMEELRYQFIDYKNNKFNICADIDYPTPNTASILKRFADETLEYVPYYKLDDGTVRNSVINLKTGYGDQVYTNVGLLSNSENILENVYLNNYLATLEPENLQSYIDANSSKYSVIYALNDNQLNLFLSKNLNDLIEVNSNLGYNLTKF